MSDSLIYKVSDSHLLSMGQLFMFTNIELSKIIGIRYVNYVVGGFPL